MDLCESRRRSRSLTRDVVDLASAVVLQPVAAAAAAAAAAPGPAVAAAAAPAGAALGTRHAHQAGGHRQLGGLGEVGQDAARRAGHPPLHLGLGLGRLGRHTGAGMFVTLVDLTRDGRLL